MQNTEGPVSLACGVNPGAVGTLGQTGSTVTLARRKLLKQAVAAIAGYYRAESEC
jgi:hypothetical protein